MDGNRIIEMRGRIMKASRWASELGVTLERLEQMIEANRTRGSGSSRKMAVRDYGVFKRHAGYNQLFEHNGEKRTRKQWAEKIGKDYKTLWDRLHRSKLSYNDVFYNGDHRKVEK